MTMSKIRISFILLGFLVGCGISSDRFMKTRYHENGAIYYIKSTEFETLNGQGYTFEPDFTINRFDSLDSTSSTMNFSLDGPNPVESIKKLCFIAPDSGKLWDTIPVGRPQSLYIKQEGKADWQNRYTATLKKGHLLRILKAGARLEGYLKMPNDSIHFKADKGWQRRKDHIYQPLEIALNQ